MANYILNKNKQDSLSGRNNELHDTTPGACIRLPDPGNQLPVGEYSSCHGAMAAAKQMYPAMAPDIDGCFHCCNECHNE